MCQGGKSHIKSNGQIAETSTNRPATVFLTTVKGDKRGSPPTQYGVVKADSVTTLAYTECAGHGTLWLRCKSVSVGRQWESMAMPRGAARQIDCPGYRLSLVCVWRYPPGHLVLINRRLPPLACMASLG